MVHTALHNEIIHKRLAFVLELIKQGGDPARIEREAAFLALDIIDGMAKKEIPHKEGCHCFTKIEYALDQKIRAHLSEEFGDMLNEGILLDEMDTKYGPDIEIMANAAIKILTRKKPLKRTAEKLQKITA